MLIVYKPLVQIDSAIRVFIEQTRHVFTSVPPILKPGCMIPGAYDSFHSWAPDLVTGERVVLKYRLDSTGQQNMRWHSARRT
jgi:hypothetical protein